jgi:hypothetical protein
MRVFFVSCLTAALIAIAAAVALDTAQTPAEVAYTTTGARI